MHSTPRHSTTRRSLAVTGLAVSAVASLLLAGCSPAADATGDGAAEPTGPIIWADYGGPTNEARQEIYFDPFMEETGIEVTSVSITDAMLVNMINGEAGDYDAMHVALYDVYQHPDSFVSLPKGATLDAALPDDINDKAWGSFLVGHALAYMTATFPDDGPKTWADYFDVEKYPGKRAWPGVADSYDSSCEIALMADGVDPDDLYPLDFDRCFKKLDELKPDIVYYTSYPEIQTLLASGTVAMAWGPSGQARALINAGEDVTISWDQALVSPNVIAIPVGGPQNPATIKLAEYMSDPKRQAEFSARTGYGPGNPEAFDYMSDKDKALVVNAPEHDKVVYYDSAYRAEAADEYRERFAAWLAG